MNRSKIVQIELLQNNLYILYIDVCSYIYAGDADPSDVPVLYKCLVSVLLWDADPAYNCVNTYIPFNTTTKFNKTSVRVSICRVCNI